MACFRHLTDLKNGWRRGLHFDETAADCAIQFFRYLRHFKGRFKGCPFILSPWQAFIVGSIFGWKRADGTRRYRKAYIRIARKNGKTALAAGIAIYMLAMDGEEAAEIYSGANTYAQAKIVWDMAALMVKASPELRKRIAVFGNPLKKTSMVNMNIEATSSKFEPVAADAENLDGLEPHLVILDEVHEADNAGLYNILKDGMGNRPQPLILLITTAGFKLDGFCVETDDYCSEILQSIHEDDEQFAFIAQLDDEDVENENWLNSANYIKANPNLGVTVRLDDLIKEAQDVAVMPSQWVNFMTKKLNRFTQTAEIWIPLALWDANAQDENGNPLTVDEEKLIGRTCFIGLDLSQSSDLTSYCLMFPRDDNPEMVDILWRHWIVRACLTDQQNKNRERYIAWEKAGYLTVFNKPAIDYDAVCDQVLADARKFNIIDGNGDRLFQGNQVFLKIQEQGIDLVAMGQGDVSFTAPCTEFERRLLLKKLNHGGNPIVRWMTQNVTLQVNKAGNAKKPIKKNRQAKIDAIVTALMALDRAMRHQANDFYSDGIIVG